MAGIRIGLGVGVAFILKWLGGGGSPDPQPGDEVTWSGEELTWSGEVITYS